MRGITYNIRNEEDSNGYYEKIAEFSEKFYVRNGIYFEKGIDDFILFLKKKKIEKIRDKREYFLELIIIGMFLKNYGSAYRKEYKFVYKFMKFLYESRKINSYLKKKIDILRGKLIKKYMGLKNENDKKEFSVENIERMVIWLEASGDFSEECIRIRKWVMYFKTWNEDEIKNFMNKLNLTEENFEKEMKRKFGIFTTDVGEFFKNELKKREGNENYIFCSRKENEYFLNMFAAEILSKAYREEFLNTPKKAVLLPSCMRYEGGKNCKAKIKGMDIKCTNCNKECNIYRIGKLAEKYGFEVSIIPHSSKFSKWLKKYENTKEYGVVGTACLLNLVKGGYEMRKLNIPSQCILLDYCGCKKHWDDNGIATDINDKKLLKVLKNGFNNSIVKMSFNLIGC